MTQYMKFIPSFAARKLRVYVLILFEMNACLTWDSENYRMRCLFPEINGKWEAPKEPEVFFTIVNFCFINTGDPKDLFHFLRIRVLLYT